MPPKNPNVTFTLELADHKALTAHLCAPSTQRSRRLARWLGPAAVVLATLVAAEFVQSVTSFLLGIIFITVLLWAIIKFMTAGARRLLQPAPGGAILCEYQLTLGPNGVELKTPLWYTLTAWAGILAVEETPEHVFLRIDSIAAYTVPKRAFASPEALGQFVNEAKALKSPAMA